RDRGEPTDRAARRPAARRRVRAGTLVPAAERGARRAPPSSASGHAVPGCFDPGGDSVLDRACTAAAGPRAAAQTGVGRGYSSMRKIRLVVAGMVLALTAIVATTASAQSHARAAEPFKIALSNSFIGNKWRIEMENDFKSACGMPPYKTQVQCSVYNSGNDVSKQTQQISNLISQGVNAILVDAASGTGLNGIIQQACARGIVVVAYDNLVTAPCALKINGSQYSYGQQNAQYIAE